MHTRAQLRLHTRTSTWTYSSTYMCIIEIYIYMHTHTYIHTLHYIHTYIYIYTHVYIYIYTRIYIYNVCVSWHALGTFAFTILLIHIFLGESIDLSITAPQQFAVIPCHQSQPLSYRDSAWISDTAHGPQQHSTTWNLRINMNYLSLIFPARLNKNTAFPKDSLVLPHLMLVLSRFR